MPLHQRPPVKTVNPQGETYHSEGDTSRNDSHEFSGGSDAEWEDEELYDDDLNPSDSASASNELPPVVRARAPRQRPARRHHLPRPQVQYQHVPAHAHAPAPPSSLDHSDDFAPYGRGGYPSQGPGGGYYGGRGHAPAYPPNHHVGPYMGGYGGGNQMVPYGNYGSPNPFSPMSNGSSGANYFGADPHRGMYDAMQYHQNQGYYGQHQPNLPAYMQQFHLGAPPPAPTDVPGPSTTPGLREMAPPDPEKMRLAAELAAYKAQQEKTKAEERERDLATQIRLDAEANFRQRMEDVRRTQEETRREIEKAKADAERAARERLEAEHKAEEERNKQHAQAMARAEENAWRKFEAERRATDERIKKEEESRARAEEAAKIRLEIAIKADKEARAATEKKAAEEVERLKLMQEDAKRVAEAEARAKLAKETAEAKTAAEAAEVAKKEAEALKKRIQDETKAKFEEAARKKTDKPPIQFSDALGRKFSFPFHLSCTWQGMEDLIRQAFQQVEALGPHVRAGHYDLTGPNGDIILPVVWDKVIQPDWTIKMTMWPSNKSPILAGRPPLHAMGGGRHGHGVPVPGSRGFPGMPPPSRRPGGAGFGPPPPPGWHGPGGPGGLPNMPSNIDVVDAHPRKGDKKKSKTTKTSWFGSSKPEKKKSHKR